MPTENPKISAYVPQVVYDRFKQFQEERGLSMSQAAIELFAEYFGINLIDNSTSEFPGGLPNRIAQLEQLIADLKQSYVYLSDKVDSIQSTSNPAKVKSDNRFFDYQGKLSNSLLESTVFTNSVNLTSLPESNQFSSAVNLSALSENRVISSLDIGLLNEPENSLHSKPKSEPLDVKIDSSDSVMLLEIKNRNHESNLQLELLSKLSQEDIDKLLPLTGGQLSKRFGKPEGFVKSKKFQMKNKMEEFLALLKSLDPQGISWQYSDQDKKYHPILENQEVKLEAMPVEGLANAL